MPNQDRQHPLFSPTEERLAALRLWRERGEEAFMQWLVSPSANRGLGFGLRSRVVYAAMWRRFLIATQGRGPFADAREIEGFLASVRAKPRHGRASEITRISVAQRARYLALLEMVQDHLMKLGILDRNLARAIAKREVPVVRPAPTALSTSDDHRLRQVLARWPSEEWKDVRDRALLTLLLECGVKVNEVLQLRLEDVQLESVAAHISVRSSSGDRRDVVLPVAAIDALGCWLEARRSLAPGSFSLFVPARRGNANLSAAQVYRLVAYALQQAGLDAKHVGPQTLRNTFATRSLNAGASPQEVSLALGYRDPASLAELAELAPSLR
jgi:integrase/recombinase XerD